MKRIAEISGEIIGAAGIIIIVLVEILGNAIDWLDPVGPAIFLAGVLVTLRKLQTGIESLKVENKLLNTLLEISNSINGRNRKKSSIYIEATGEVLNNLISGYVPNLAQDLKKLDTSHNVSFQVRDNSPVFDLMYNLGRSLPANSAWLGITLLESTVAWNTPFDDKFLAFRSLMQKRAGHDLNVFRLYNFKKEKSFQELKSDLEKEKAGGIITGVLVGEKSPPPDISLLYYPPTKKIDSINKTNPIDSLAESGCKPLCLLVYDTKAGALLSKIEIWGGESDQFKRKEEIFRHAWNQQNEANLQLHSH